MGEVGSYTSPPYFHVCFWGVQEDDLVQLLAKHCYVQLGASVGSEAVQELLPSCIPSKLYKTKPPEKWASLVTAAHAKVSLHGAWALGLCSLLWDRGPRCVEGHRPPTGQWETLICQGA